LLSARPGRVIVVGAGPTGLTLAGELALAGVQTLVLERRPGLRTDSRAICLHARSMEMLDLRGLAETFASTGLPVPSFPLGLRGAAIGLGRLDSDFPYLLDLPQGEIEALLAARAEQAGAQIAWSRQVTGVEQDDSEVRVTLADGETALGDYLVACDGIRSFVRESLGIPFPGIHNPGSVILADLTLDGLAMDDAYGDLSRQGMLLVFPLRGGSCRVVLYDYSRAQAPVTEPVTLDEVAASLVRVAGRDFQPRDMYWSRRYRSQSRQVPGYRAGRVFLAGDAAHTHSPAGAQGLNAGLQDAMNLGWKLGAAVTGWAPDWLLDTYHAERHPVGSAVLALTGRQFRLNTASSLPGRAVRWLAQRAAAPAPFVQSRLAESYSGISIRYPAGAGAHRLAGARLPRGHITLANGSIARMYELFRDGRFVLLDRDGPDGLPPQVSAVRYRGCTVRLPAAMLVRPDGYVAWASGDRDPARRQQEVRRTVAHWCGRDDGQDPPGTAPGQGRT
jgi:2-polyprenyl-6-methoxyphenol hydroxylase-like FAD-dependent oxidoreductase